MDLDILRGACIVANNCIHPPVWSLQFTNRQWTKDNGWFLRGALQVQNPFSNLTFRIYCQKLTDWKGKQNPTAISSDNSIEDKDPEIEIAINVGVVVR